MIARRSVDGLLFLSLTLFALLAAETPLNQLVTKWHEHVRCSIVAANNPGQGVCCGD